MRIVQEIARQKWSDFVYRHPKGNIFQTPEMYEVYLKTKNYQPFFLSVISNSGEVLAVLLSVVQREAKGILGELTARSIILGGPLVINDERDIFELILNAYDEIAGKRAIYSQFRNMYNMEGFADIFSNLGYLLEDHLDILIDLTKPIDLLWREIHSTRRKQIKRASRRGLRVKVLEKLRDIEKPYSIILEVYKNAKLPIVDPSMFAAANDILSSHGMVVYFVALDDDEIVGVRYILAYRDILYDWYGGSLREYLTKYPNDIIPWEIFKWGKEKGYRMFDFGGAGRPGRKYGVRNYKKRFGGKIVNYGRLQKTHKPLKFVVAKTGFRLWEIRRGF